MSDLIVIQPSVTQVTVTEDVNDVIVSSVGVQGAKGDTGATGATGATGSSGVIAVTAPITNSGTSTSANIGISAGSTSAAGALQLTDSVSSTSTTTAATPNAVKTAYDSSLVKGVQLPYRSGAYYKTPNSQYTNMTASHQTLYFTPIFINTSNTFDRIAIITAATFLGSATVRLGIFQDNNGVPGNLVLDAGTVSPIAASTIYQITISQTLTTGFYWVAFCQQSTAPTTATYQGNTNSQIIPNLLINASSTVGANQLAGFFQSSVSGAFSNAGTVTATTLCPFVWLRSA
jgi:hypothetical protein